MGRPFLFGTTDEFLRKFQLENIGDLPDYNEVLDRISVLDANFRNSARDGLYFERELKTDEPDFIEVGGPAVPEFSAEAAADEEQSVEPSDADNFDDFDEIPDFLKDEDIKEYK